MRSMGKNVSALRIFADWWWVFAVLSIIYLLYLQSIKEKRLWIAKLDAQVEELHSQKLAYLDMQEELNLMITSQSDPAWIEMTLIKQMGVVPEGKRKIKFAP